LDSRKDLDLRYGLDSKGKRKGRMLPFKQSELRATELIENLCDEMKNYGVATSAATKQLGWLQIQGDRKQTLHMDLGGGSLGDIMGSTFGDKVSSDGKRLQGYCSTILEEREEVLVAALMDGRVDATGKSEEKTTADIIAVLCQWEKRKKKSPCALEDEGKIEL